MRMRSGRLLRAPTSLSAPRTTGPASCSSTSCALEPASRQSTEGRSGAHMAARFCESDRSNRPVTSASSRRCRTKPRTLKCRRNRTPTRLYSDRPVAVEPGLSIDVLPIANLVAKLALLELLAGEESSLNILQKDFDAPWYLWLNRPEPGTQDASLPALSESADEMTIHRWYGVYLARDTECSVCGDFLAAMAGHYGVDLSSLGDLPAPRRKEG